MVNTGPNTNIDLPDLPDLPDLQVPSSVHTPLFVCCVVLTQTPTRSAQELASVRRPSNVLDADADAAPTPSQGASAKGNWSSTQAARKRSSKGGDAVFDALRIRSSNINNEYNDAALEALAAIGNKKNVAECKGGSLGALMELDDKPRQRASRKSLRSGGLKRLGGSIRQVRARTHTRRATHTHTHRAPLFTRVCGSHMFVRVAGSVLIQQWRQFHHELPRRAIRGHLCHPTPPSELHDGGVAG